MSYVTDVDMPHQDLACLAELRAVLAADAAASQQGCTVRCCNEDQVAAHRLRGCLRGGQN
jgi:hypothetical protein